MMAKKIPILIRWLLTAVLSTLGTSRTDVCTAGCPAISTDGLTLRAHDVKVRRFVCPATNTRSLAFGFDGKYAVAGLMNGTLAMWRVQPRRRLWSIQAHTSTILDLAFDSYSGRLLTASSDKTAAIWEMTVVKNRSADKTDLVPTLVHRLQGHSGWVVSGAFGSGGKTVVTGSNDRTSILWNSTTGALLRVLPEHSAAVVSVSLSPDGQWLVTNAGDNSSKLWDAQVGREIRELDGHKGWTVKSSFLRDSSTLLTVSHDNSARLWNLPRGEVLQVFEGDWSIASAAVSPDGFLLLTGDANGKATFWHAKAGMALRTHVDERSAPVKAITFSANGRSVLLGSIARGKPKQVQDGENVRAQCKERCKDGKSPGDEESKIPVWTV